MSPVSAGPGEDPPGDRWETTAEIAAAQRRFETGLPGWRPPAAYGVGRLGADGRAEFAHRPG